MRIFIDIDQTISSGRVADSLQESVRYYRDRGISVPETITCYPDLFQLPDIVRLHETLPGARDGVHQLAQHGDISYATVRNTDVEEITRLWLQEHDFPSTQDVIFSQSMAHKLLAISHYPGQLVLIDDRWQKALEVLPRVIEHSPETAQHIETRLTLVAFGASVSDLPGSPLIPMLALPDWSRVPDVIHQFTITSGGVH